jgi:predicted RNA binding protein YcfA (HicA-like mRNA interferase family)
MSPLRSEPCLKIVRTVARLEDRQAGAHLTLRHATRRVAVTVPVHTGTDVGRGLAVRILKDAGFTVDDYLRLP